MATTTTCKCGGAAVIINHHGVALCRFHRPARLDIDALRDELAYSSPRPVHGEAFDMVSYLAGFSIAHGRAEHEPCQAGTIGCCVDHDAAEHGCETW